MTKTQFKTFIKECLIELVKEGALNEAIQVMHPNVQAAASQLARNPQERGLLEAMMADTMQNELPKHMQNDVGGMAMGNAYAQPQQPQYVQVPPAIPWQQQHSVQPQQSQPNQTITKWAQLAFNSPIKNRPESGGVSVPGIPSGFLPGQSKGRFG